MKEFREALRSFVKESCDFLSSSPPESREWRRVVRQPDGSTSFPVELRPDYSRALEAFSRRLRTTTWFAFDRVLEIVRGNSGLRSALLVDAGGKPVKGEEAERWWLRGSLAEGVVHAYVRKARTPQFQEPAFRELFDELRIDLESEEVIVTEFSPLLNVEIESREVAIEPRIRICQLPSDHLETWLNAERLFTVLPLSDFDLLGLRCAVEAVYRKSKLAPFGSDSSVGERVSRVLTAMRLVTDASPKLAFTQRTTNSLFHYGPTSWDNVARPFAQCVTIKRSQELELLEIYGQLSSSPNRNKADLALRRWNSASDRLIEEDKLIDYWVGLESLFLPDDDLEKTYRAALRIAAFLGAIGLDRERIFKEMKESYRLRSTIVHGSIPKKKGKMTTPELSNLTRSYLRQALLKVLRLSQQFDPAKLEAQLLLRE